MRAKKQRPPSRLMLVGGLLVLMALAIFAFYNATTTNSTSGAPQLNVSQNAIDLGEVKLGAWVSASFQVTNTGTGTLRFQESPYIEVAAGC